jgi:hypothetical protein
MFGWLVTNEPELCHLKKAVLMLVAAKILGFRIHFSDDVKEKKHQIVPAQLLKSEFVNGPALHSDECWTTLELC